MIGPILSLAALAAAATPPGYTPPSYAPAKTPVDSKALQASILESALSQKARELQDAAYGSPQRNRVFSSPGHEKTLQFIEGYLETVRDYYDVRRQKFQALFSQASGNFSVDGTAYSPTIYQYSPSSLVEGVTAVLVPVANNGCNALDYSEQVSGAIALISRGVCEFGLKSSLAGAAGAAGAVIYNNAPGPVSGGTLGAPPRAEGDYVPTAGITQENGTALLEAITSGQTIEGLLQVDSVLENRTTYNIIADSKGGDKNNILALGAHSDSVSAGPGINDDGSGTIGLLETALQLARYTTTNAVRFCFWSAEEFGLLGSEFYASQINGTAEAEKIRLYLNFDMIASPNYVYALYDGDGSAFNITGPPGSTEAEAFFENWFAEQGIPTKETDFDGRSDYGPFLDIGVAAGGIFTGAEELKTEEEAALFGGEAGVAYDVNYHQAGDNYTNLNFEAFLINTKAIAAATAFYTTSFDSLPPRNATVEGRKRRSVSRRFQKRQNKVMHSHHMHDCARAEKVTY